MTGAWCTEGAHTNEKFESPNRCRSGYDAGLVSTQAQSGCLCFPGSSPELICICAKEQQRSSLLSRISDYKSKKKLETFFMSSISESHSDSEYNTVVVRITTDG